MQRLPTLSIVLAAVLAAIVLPAAGEPSAVSVTPLKGSLYLLQGRGGNVVASVGEDGILLVDDDYAEQAPAYREALDGLDPTRRVPRFVINTHWHGDHVGGNGYWSERGSVVVAHTNVRRRMSVRQEMPVLGRVVEASPPAALPVVTYGDSVALHFNGGTVEVQHYPRGHTDGDSIVFFVDANVVHLGDHMFRDRFPFVDVGSGGNVFGYIANLQQVLRRIDGGTVIVPGHGSVADLSDLRRYLDMLVTTTSLVRDKLEGGMGVDAVIEEGLGPSWAPWGEGFIDEAAWIRTIAASL